MPARVRVYDSAIQGLFTPGGDAHDEARDITRKIETSAIRRALKFARSGEIARSHYRTVRTTTLGVRGTVGNRSDHAYFKHKGTQGPIRSNRGTITDSKGRRQRAKMRLRRGNGYPSMLRASVSGQRGDPWLRKAANGVLWRYGVQVTDADVEF